MVAIGGTDISTGLEFEGVFTAPEGSTVISPLTTLVDQVMKANSGMDTSTASNLVASSLGLTGVTGEELLAFDPIKAATATDATAEQQANAVAIQTAAVQIVNVIAQTANAVESTSNEDSTEEAALKAVSSLASLVQSGSTLDLSSSSTVESVLNDTVGDNLTSAQKTAIANATSNVNQAMQDVSDTNDGSATTEELITKLAQTQLVAKDVATEVKTSIKEKTNTIIRFLESRQHSRGIIFCRTKAGTQNLNKLLQEEGFSIGALEGDMQQKERDKVMRAFKNESLQYLISTDVSARGIDVRDLAFVIHHQLPDQLDYYTHRSGRTARAGKKGISIALILPNELQRVHEIEKDLNIKFTETNF